MLPLRELLSHKLESIGRLSIAQEEFDLLSQREWTEKPFDPDDFIRIKHSSGLEDPGLRVLRQLYVYRDEQAREMNLPTYKVSPNQFLILLARKRP